MENATKALMMAGGVLLALLVISLLVYAWGSFSDYYDNQSSLSDIEDLTEFNLQFTNYDRDDVMGYEIISLMNKVVDYNNTSSYLDDADSNDAYEPITMTVYGETRNSSTAWSALSFGSIKVYLGTDESGTEITYPTNSNVVLFTSATYYVQYLEDADGNITSTGLENSLDDLVESIESWAVGECGDLTSANNIAKSMSSIALSKSQLDYNLSYEGMTYEESYQVALNTYNSLTNGTKYTTGDSILSIYKDMIKNICDGGNDSILGYYEYYQFKKGVFECTGIGYDSDTGRVSSIEFTFTGEIE